MTRIIDGRAGEQRLLMGNEALARGALEAGIRLAAAYPGTPSSEILASLADAASERQIYVEWSANEKVALEVAAAGSFAGLRTLCAMKQNGVHVASDFLLHLAASGTRGGMVLLPCDDPGALSSINEGESRHFARMIEVPLLEPGDFQEAKDMLKWAFELSEAIRGLVMLRSVTRLSHASGSVALGPLPEPAGKADFIHGGSILDPMHGAVTSAPVASKHRQQQERISRAQALFEASPFNTYTGPEAPELLVVTSSAANLYTREAIQILGLSGRVGLVKLGTTWPLPPNLLKTHLSSCSRILVVEEVLPFLEENIKVLAAELAPEIGAKTFYGKRDGTLPSVGELTPDLVIAALGRIFDIPCEAAPAAYTEKAGQLALAGAPPRDWTFCAGCPHRASFWSIHNALALDNRRGFICGDIGCYSMAVGETGFSSLKTLHSMGSGTGLASGFAKLGRFGMDQSVVAVCGDSTFFHAVLPALANAVHHESDFTLVVLDNSGTAMTGFQPHPGMDAGAGGEPALGLDIGGICRAMGAEVAVSDPFDLDGTQQLLLEMLNPKAGVRVLILRQSCALSPERRHAPRFAMQVAEDLCIGEECGCNRLCTRVFKCPGLYWDDAAGTAGIDEALCAGCGVCAEICPSGAITRKEVA